MICLECDNDKTPNDFYYEDGGLGLTTNRISICKDCIRLFNSSRQRNKYYREQIVPMYFGAKLVAEGRNLYEVAGKIDNGISEGSNRMAIQNFLYLLGKQGGLESSSRMMREIYDFFEKRNVFDISYPDEIDNSDKIYTEGSVKQVLVNKYERDPEARKICIERNGFVCSICQFNFEEFYGDIGKKFIHVHHIKPLSEIKQEYQIDPENDLVPVCPNCHAMIHKRNPPFSPEEVKAQLKK